KEREYLHKYVKPLFEFKASEFFVREIDLFVYKFWFRRRIRFSYISARSPEGKTKKENTKRKSSKVEWTVPTPSKLPNNRFCISSTLISISSPSLLLFLALPPHPPPSPLSICSLAMTPASSSNQVILFAFSLGKNPLTPLNSSTNSLATCIHFSRSSTTPSNIP